MRPDERELDEEIRGHLALSVRSGSSAGRIRRRRGWRRLREFGYVPAIRDSMRRVWYSRWFDAGDGVRPGHARRLALASPRQRPRRDRRGHAGARHRRQRRDLQRRARRAAAPARQSRRGSPGLHPPERAGPRRRRTRRSRCPRSRIFKSRVDDHQRVRRLLDDRLHDDRLRRAARRPGRRRRAARTST